MHRPRADGEKYAKRNDPSSIEGRVYLGIRKLIAFQEGNEAFCGGELEIISTENDHVLGFMHRYMGKRVVIFANLAESPQNIPSHVCEHYSIHTKQIVNGSSRMPSGNETTIEPLDFLVFE